VSPHLLTPTLVVIAKRKQQYKKKGKSRENKLTDK